MSTLTFPVGMLHCPKCAGRLQMFLYTFDPHYGSLRCDCREVPIVHSIPVFRDFAAGAEVLEMIRDRRAKEALILTLGAFSRHKNFEKGGPHDPRTKAGQARLYDLIDNPLITTQQFLTAVAPPDEAEALFYRPAAPGFLSGICLAGLIPTAGELLLHVPCGAGHLMRALSVRHPAELLMGVDEDFSKLYAARRFMSENSHFVCASISAKLPFRNDLFNAVIVEPAGFGDALASEVDRTARPDSLILGTQFASADAFASRFRGRAVRSFSIASLAKQMVKSRTFDASAREKPDGEAAVVVASDNGAFRKVDLEDLLGCRVPRPSPVYDLDDKGDLYEARRRSGLPESVASPSLLEAGALPDQAEIEKQLLKQVQDGEVSDKALELLSRLVVVDLPQDYA